MLPSREISQAMDKEPCADAINTKSHKMPLRSLSRKIDAAG
jgi:hypothetical protein